MCRLICSVDDPAWTRDADKLIQLLAAVENLKRRELNDRGRPTADRGGREEDE
jgi:hypothetical protein